MTEPLWLSVARAFEGISEIPGDVSNPVILRWAKDLGIRAIYTNDDTAWCALWMNRLALACQLPVSGSGYDLLRARSFIRWGVDLSFPILGAMMVFTRPEGHHVGLYLGERTDAYRVLGGNTTNAVGPTWIKKDRLVAIRWPDRVPLPIAKRVLLEDDGQPASTNEA